MNEEMFETNDKGAKIAVLIVIIVAILCVLGYFVYDILFNRPSLKLLSFISKIDEWEIFKEESVKLSGDLTIEAKTKDLKFLEDASSNYAIIADDKKDTIMFTFNYKEKDNTIFVLDGYIDDKIAAFKSDKIFDNNVLYADIKDEVKNNQESDFEYIIGIYAKALATSFKAEKPVKEEIKVTINNDTIKLKENKYIVTKENVEKINNNYRKSILNDDKALTILAKYSTKTKEEIKKEVEKEYYLVDPKDLEEDKRRKDDVQESTGDESILEPIKEEKKEEENLSDDNILPSFLKDWLN